MTQQIINVGSVADDGTGDDLRTAFNKCNGNFSELYGAGVGGAGGGVYAYQAISTTPTMVAPANALRVSILFHNPGTTTMYVAPQTVLALGGPSVPLSPNPTSLGGCFVVFPGASLVLTGSCKGQWNALAATGTSPFTVMDNTG